MRKALRIYAKIFIDMECPAKQLLAKSVALERIVSYASMWSPSAYGAYISGVNEAGTLEEVSYTTPVVYE